MKECTKCGLTKTPGGFYKRSGRSSGLSSWCKSCMDSLHKEHRKTNIRTKLLDLLTTAAYPSRSKKRPVSIILKDKPSKYIDGLVRMYLPKCRYCGVKLDNANASLDHIYPLSRGGSYEIENIQVICSTCNQGKGIQTEEEFFRWINQIKVNTSDIGIGSPQEANKVD